MAAAVDHVLGSVEDGHVAVGIDAGQIAGAEPPVGDGRRRRLRIAVVAGGHQRASHQQLPGLVGAQVVAVVVDHPRLHARKGPAHRSWLVRELVVEEDRGRRVGLGQAVDVTQGQPGQAPAQLGDGRQRHRRATEPCDAKVVERRRGQGPNPQQALPQCRDQVEPGDALPGDEVDELCRAGVGHQHAAPTYQEHGQQVGVHGADVGEGEHHGGDVVAIEAHRRREAEPAVHAGPVHDAAGLGATGGAAGVDHRVGVGLVGSIGGDVGPATASTGEVVAEGSDPLGGQTGDGGGGEKVVDEGRLGQGQARPGVVEEVGPLVGRRPGAQPDQHAPGAGAGEQGHREVEAVVADHGQAVTPPHPFLAQPLGRALDELGELPEADLSLGGGDEGAVGEAPYRPVEHVEHGPRPVRVAERRGSQPLLVAHGPDELVDGLDVPLAWTHRAGGYRATAFASAPVEARSSRGGGATPSKGAPAGAPS